MFYFRRKRFFFALIEKTTNDVLSFFSYFPLPSLMMKNFSELDDDKILRSKDIRLDEWPFQKYLLTKGRQGRM